MRTICTLPRVWITRLGLALAVLVWHPVLAPLERYGEPAAAAPAAYAPGCGAPHAADALLAELRFETYVDWIGKLSGERPVVVGGQRHTIRTRYSPTLFDGRSAAYDFVRAQVLAWYPAAQVQEHTFAPPPSMDTPGGWKNLILTIPGSALPQEEVLLTAHLDSTSSSPTTLAPGANDNATGAAALLEAARILQGRPLARTLRIIWFTGEEQGMLGSAAYAAEHDLSGVQAVINLDMFGHDRDGDRCFELHVGTLAESAHAAGCFAFAVQAYAPELRFDTLTTSATTSSDHAPFWREGVGAVEVLENHFNLPSADGFPTGCSGRDPSPHYHRTTDTLANMHPAYAYAIARAGLAAAIGLASPNLVYIPMVQ